MYSKSPYLEEKKALAYKSLPWYDYGMSEYSPDRWVIVKFKKEDKTWYKVLGSWAGGYLDGDSWRMSSGLERIEEEGNYVFYLFCIQEYRSTLD